MTDTEDRCGLGEDDHQVLIKVEYGIEVSDDGESVTPTEAAIHTHLHGVPPDAAASTLMLIAHQMMSDHMAHTTFGECPSHELAHAMANAAASAYLSEAVKNLPQQATLVTVEIPDDVSSLLEGE